MLSLKSKRSKAIFRRSILVAFILLVLAVVLFGINLQDDGTGGEEQHKSRRKGTSNTQQTRHPATLELKRAHATIAGRPKSVGSIGKLKRYSSVQAQLRRATAACSTNAADLAAGSLPQHADSVINNHMPVQALGKRHAFAAHVTASTQLHLVKKAGMPPHSLLFGFDPKFLKHRGPKRMSRFTDAMRPKLLHFLCKHAFLQQRALFKPIRTPVSPPAAGCWPAFNVRYKFVLMRTAKTGGTSIETELSKAHDCGPETIHTSKAVHCLYRQHRIDEAGGPQSLGYASWEALWADYLVFSPIRNPYDRAGSSFEYLSQGSWRQARFPTFAARPWIIGLESLLVSRPSAFPKPYHIFTEQSLHDLWHTEPQTKCMVTAEGNWAVDMVVRMESASDDMAKVIAAINERRNATLPEFTFKMKHKNVSAPKGKDGKPSVSRHVQKYEKCGMQCLLDIEAYYSIDFGRLGYPR